VTFQQAVQSGFQNYVNFQDRSGRSEFWYWVLFAAIVGVVANVIDAVLGTGFVVGALTSLALLLPGIAVGVRRLHDIGKSGWYVLIGLIPIVGLIYLIYVGVQPTEGPNQYGAGPLQAAAG
jgi:uncharacterized membrane protein YhaH (DUF805 family)